MDNFNDDTLSTDEKMLIYMIREYDLPIQTIFTNIYKAYNVDSRKVVGQWKAFTLTPIATWNLIVTTL